jgi:hypothetical protein
MGIKDSNKHEITDNFASKVQTICKQLLLSPSNFIIDEDTAIRAIYCIEYFNKHKLLLSGYQFSPNSSFSEIFKVILAQNNNKKTEIFSPNIGLL